MLGIQSGHTDHSQMLFGREKTQEATITREGGCFGPGKTVIDAGKGNDDINIHTNEDGSVDVTINGEVHNFSAQEAKNLEVRGGKGNDNITCTGEAQDDNSFMAKLFGNTNRDPNITIDGGKGDDTIAGGCGNETIRGGKGNDVISGGCNDFIMGDCGNDTIHGGKGNDSISGGCGNDNLYGDKGRDFVHGGDGKDWVQGGSKERGFMDNIMGNASPKDMVKEHSLFDRFFTAIRG
jgi:Ca2+-binding RTX toxin-like protein